VAGSYERGNELSVPLKTGNISKWHELLGMSESVPIRITGMLYWSQLGLCEVIPALMF
jgi:hypothetical protein